MSKYRVQGNFAGSGIIGQSFAPDAVARQPLVGSIVAAFSAFWGGGEFIYCQFSGAIREKALVSLTALFDAPTNRWITQATEVTNVANLGRAVGVAVMPAANGQYGWVQISGTCVVNSAAAIAVDTAFGIGAVGQAGAVAAGKAVLSGRVHGAATTTVVKASVGGNAGEFTVKVNNIDGWFVGGYVSGTGIGATAKVVSIDTDEKTVTLSAANTAVVSGNLTMTYNNGVIFYPIVYLNRPTAQGPIT